MARFPQGGGLNFVALQEQLQSDNVKKEAHRDEKSRLLLNQHFLWSLVELFTHSFQNSASAMLLINVVLRCKQFYSCVQSSTSDGGDEELKARDARLSWVCCFVFAPLPWCKAVNTVVHRRLAVMEILKISKTNASVTWKFARIASASFWNFWIYICYMHLG